MLTPNLSDIDLSDDLSDLDLDDTEALDALSPAYKDDSLFGAKGKRRKEIRYHEEEEEECRFIIMLFSYSYYLC